MTEFWRRIGVLRGLHALALLALILTAPFAGDDARGVWPALVAPALAPMFTFIALLDVLLAAIGKSGADAVERGRLNRVILLNLAMLAALLLAWLPFFARLLALR